MAAEPAALPSQRRVTSKAHTLAELAEENDWKNDVVLFWLPQHFRCGADPGGGPARSQPCSWGSLKYLHCHNKPVWSRTHGVKACTCC